MQGTSTQPVYLCYLDSTIYPSTEQTLQILFKQTCYAKSMKIIVNRTREKTLKICPQSDGSVNVFAYKFLSQKCIAKHIAENISWINARLNKMIDSSTLSESSKCSVSHAGHASQTLYAIDEQMIKDIFVGKRILLCGQVYNCCCSSQKQTHLKDDYLCIYEKNFTTKELRLKSIASYLKRMSSSMLSQEVSQIGCDLALCPTKIQFKDIGGRWCNCIDAESRAITLDYRLIQLPKYLQRFVIAHAFAHFLKKGHTSEFYNLLSSYVPNYKNCQNELSKYNFLLDV